MSTDIYTRDEQVLLNAWIDGEAPTLEQEALLLSQVFDHDCKPYMRLQVWVGV